MKSSDAKCPPPEAKPIADYIHTDENGREYIVISRMVTEKERCGYEQFRRYLEPFDEATAHRSFIPFHPV